MDEVKFSDQSYQPQTTYVPPTEKGLVGWLVKRKLAKDAKQANLVMVGIVLVCVTIIGTVMYLRSHTNNFDTTPEPQYDADGMELIT